MAKAKMVDRINELLAEQKANGGFVYVLTGPHAVHGLVSKIGSTGDWRGRLLNLALHCADPSSLKISYVGMVEPGKYSAYGEPALKFEKSIHFVLDEHRLHGEWFKHSEDLIPRIKHLARVSKVTLKDVDFESFQIVSRIGPRNLGTSPEGKRVLPSPEVIIR